MLRNGMLAQKNKMGVVLEILGKEVDDLKEANTALQQQVKANDSAEAAVSKFAAKCEALEKSNQELAQRLTDMERNRSQVRQNGLLAGPTTHLQRGRWSRAS